MYEEIRDAGARLVAISPQLPEHSAIIAKRHTLAFPVLSDQGNEVARKFGIVFEFPDDLRQTYLSFGADLAKFNGDDSWTLPMPGRFLADATGTIRDVEVDPDYTRRPEPSETVAALRRMTSS